MEMQEGKVIVTGAASGLGSAIVEALRKLNITAVPLDKAYHASLDVTDTSLWGACPSDVVGVINCAGINGADWFEDVTVENFDKIMATNARSIMQVSQWALPALKANRGTICNVVSNASHMPMTSSLAYNASKAAAHIMTQQMARELTKKYGITVFGVSPNKLAGTGMSKAIEENVQRVRGWTPEFAAQYQLQALLAGEETDVETCAEFIAFLLSSKKRHKYLSGCVIPYGA